MRHIMLAVALTAAIVAAVLALVADADAREQPNVAAYTVSYLKAVNAGAIFFDVADCDRGRCTGIYEAAATIDGRDGYVRCTYTIRQRAGEAWSLSDDHFTVISKWRISDDQNGRAKRRGL